MRYVITGASGHIGNNLVRYINRVDKDAKIVSLTRRIVGEELEGAILEQVVGDVCDIEFLRANVSKDDIVIHLVGYIDLTNKHRDEAYKINYVSAKNMCDVCEDVGVKKLVYVGSVDAIYRENKNELISEPEEYYPERMRDGYSQTKAMASQYILSRMRANTEFNASIILPTCVIGINDYKPSAVGRIIRDVVAGKAELGMKGGYNFVDVDDVCRVIYDCANSTNNGQYIISGHNVTIEKFYDKVNKVLDKKSKPIIFPDWLVYLAMPFVKVLNKVTIRAVKEPHNYTSAKAAAELGYVATPIDETIKKTVEWFSGRGV